MLTIVYQVWSYNPCAVNTPIAHSDIDLCFRIREAGLRCVYTPYATLSHAGHASIAVEEKKELRASAPSGAAKRRLNFNEKHALETLPKTIAKLQAEIAKQQRHLDDPNLYNKNRKKFDQASDALTKAQKELQEAEDKWLELEVLREEIEQA